MSKLRLSVLVAAAGITACSDSVTEPPPPPPPPNIVIVPNRVSLTVGETVLLRISGISTRLTAIWTSENPEVAAVAIGGLLKGMQAGHTTITARAGELSASVEVTVVAAPDTADSACPSWVASRCLNPRGRPRPF